METWLPRILWGVAGAMLLLVASLIFWKPEPALSSAAEIATLPAAAPTGEDSPVSAPPVTLAAFEPELPVAAISRIPNPRTTIPDQATDQVKIYTVVTGDALFTIAKDNKVQPETVLWANYSVLNDNADTLAVGQKLNIPPVDGVYYQWQEDDTLKGVADRFHVTPEDITGWPGNRLDMADPVIQPGQYIMVPGGRREVKPWVVAVPARDRSGVIKNILGPGGCDIKGGLVGGGGFVWPADNHNLSGNDFWSGHLGIDIAAAMGAPVYASDTGVVVYAGPISGGYGNMIMIDHGNGYQTLYAHLSQFAVRCGNNVVSGQVIGYAGSTGNSTGPHLHFEVRYLGGFVNPWKVLP